MRLMILQALIMILAFSVAGLLTQAAITELTDVAVRREVIGEANSLVEEWRKKGAAHLPLTIQKRTRLWRGFEYNIATPTGGWIAGDRRLVLSAPGWRTVQADKTVKILTYTQRLPDGTWLSVGQDLAVERRQLDAVARSLWISGGAGVLIALGASYLLARRTWRRIDQLAQTAAKVSSGNLNVRAPVRQTRETDEVDDLARAFNGMLDRVGRLVAQVRQVTTDVAHDMRTPLTRVRHRLERLEEAAKGDPALSAGVRRIDADLSEILRTFDAMLQLAEIESADRDMVGADLAEIAGRVGEAYRPDIECSGRRLILNLRPAPVAGEVELLSQMVANLLENALRHTPVGATMTLSVDQGGGRSRLVLSDDGPGVPAHLRAAALAPFGRLEASRNKPGSGLGLSIVAAVAARHGAKLDLGDARPGLIVSAVFPVHAEKAVIA
ncbi:MAG: HAMP domain-containing histidine kinase [Alphaproteobacteria bacterium]|nr:HAMP domain-containing histidine kinase [Alphaproteobacteria bacterium]